MEQGSTPKEWLLRNWGKRLPSPAAWVKAVSVLRAGATSSLAGKARLVWGQGLPTITVMPNSEPCHYWSAVEMSCSTLASFLGRRF